MVPSDNCISHGLPFWPDVVMLRLIDQTPFVYVLYSMSTRPVKIAFRVDSHAIQSVPLVACRLVDNWLRPLFESMRIGLDQTGFACTGVTGRILVMTTSRSNGRSMSDFDLAMTKFPISHCPFIFEVRASARPDVSGFC